MRVGVGEISRALAGEWVQLIRIENRILVYYCRTLVRELDLLHQRSTAVNLNLDCKSALTFSRQTSLSL